MLPNASPQPQCSLLLPQAFSYQFHHPMASHPTELMTYQLIIVPQKNTVCYINKKIVNRNVDYSNKKYSELTLFLFGRCLDSSCTFFSSLFLLFGLFTKEIHIIIIFSSRGLSIVLYSNT